MPTHQYESIYDQQVTQYLDRAKLALNDKSYQGENYIKRLEELVRLAAEILLFKDKVQLEGTPLKEQLENCLQKINIKVGQLIEKSIKNCFATTENSIPDLYLALQNGEQLCNTFKAGVEEIYRKAGVEEIYRHAYDRFFGQIMQDKKQEFIDILIVCLENGDPPFDPDKENILEALEAAGLPNLPEEWEKSLKDAWKEAKEAEEAQAVRFETATNADLISMMLKISKDYKDNANKVQIKARKYDLAFIEQCITQINGDENLDIYKKTNLLLGAIYSVLDILEEEKRNSNSIGMGLLHKQLEDIKNTMKTWDAYNDNPDPEIYRKDFKEYLQLQKATFDQFNLTKKILPEEPVPTHLLSFKHSKHSPQQAPSSTSSKKPKI